MPIGVVARLRGPERDAAGEDVPVVLARVEDGHGLVDLRCIPPEQDENLLRALQAAMGAGGAGPGRRAGIDQAHADRVADDTASDPVPPVR